MNITKIRSRNIMFTVPEYGMVNMAVILGTKHNFIIDTGTGSDPVHAMLEYIEKDSKPLVVVNTHGDWDHVAGNWVLEDRMIIAHVLGREVMDKEWEKQVQIAKEEDRCFEGEIRKCLPNILFEESLHFPEDGIRLFHTPGHTRGCISIYDSVDKVLHAGDSFGVSDGKASFWESWNRKINLSDFKRLVEIYQQCDFEICITGHSEPQTKEVMALLEAAWVEAANS